MMMKDLREVSSLEENGNAAREAGGSLKQSEGFLNTRNRGNTGKLLLKIRRRQWGFFVLFCFFLHICLLYKRNLAEVLRICSRVELKQFGALGSLWNLLQLHVEIIMPPFFYLSLYYILIWGAEFVCVQLTGE